MKPVFLTILVTFFIFLLSAALTFLSNVTNSGWLWMLGVSAVLFCTVGLVILVVLLLKDLTQTDGRPHVKPKSQRTDAQAQFIAQEDSQKLSPYGRYFRRRDRTMERSAIDGRPTAQTPIRPPTDSFVRGRKTFNGWYEKSPRSNREDGFHNINQR